MAQTKKTIASQLNSAQVAINNTLADAEIQTAVAAYGYSTEKINQGKTLYDNAVAMVNAQIAAAGAQRDATASTAAAKQQAHTAYQSPNDRLRRVMLRLTIFLMN